MKSFAFTLSNLNIYYIRKKHKKLYKNNKFKVSAPTWIEEFEQWPDGSNSISYIQDYFEYILKKHGEPFNENIHKQNRK